jgi:hypothetical protein
MNTKFLLICFFLAGFSLLANAGDPQRIGHTTLTPRHNTVTNSDGSFMADDKGMYSAAIDPTSGYAYFIGTYLFKLDITGNLPVQVGPSINTGQLIQNAIDPAAGYLYLPKGTLNRFSLGAGTNAVVAAGSLALAAGSAGQILIDDSDPNPANHYGYVICTSSGNPVKVAKVALGTFTELGSTNLLANETNFLFGSVADAQKGYAYFVTQTISNTSWIVKIKMTPGINPPGRIGAASLSVSNATIDGGCIDTVHGYAYFDTYSSDTNIPATVFKVKLGDGDVAPTVVGNVSLHAGEGRLSAGIVDPTNGFVYFANDNTYPGGVYQLSLNGTNLPVEITYLSFQSGTSSTNPPNGVTAQNTTTNSDGLLPFGEVFFRSAVFDPVRGCAYFGQDSRPNQVVKMRVAQIDPFTLTGAQIQNGSFQSSFMNIAGASFSVLASTNLALPLSNWIKLGSVTEISHGQFQFSDSQAANNPDRFYRVSSP